MPPAVIVECAFLDNKKDVQIIDTEAEQKAMGVAVAKGVLKTLGVAWQPEATYAVSVPGLDKAEADKLVASLKKDGYAAKLKKE